jgi:signal transduction histidine kinase
LRWSEASVRWRWRDLPLREKGIIVVAIPVVPLLLSAALFYYTQRRAEEADQWVSHTLAIRAELSQLLALLVDREHGARGYLLARSPEPLATYRTATAALPRSFATLETLVTDSEQRERLRRLPLRLRDSPLSSIIQYVDSTMPGAPVPLELLARSRASMGALRVDLAAMQTAEDVLLASRSAYARQTRRQALGVVIGGALVGLIGGIIAALILTATVARRIGEVTANARRLASGESVAPMAVSRDEVGVLAGSLERASALLRERDIELQRQLDEVAATNRELEAFSYSVSHDLRAPLRHVAGFASLLEKRAGDGLDPEGRRHLRTIVEAAARMGRLVDDLLEFSRMGRADMVRKTVNLNDVVQDVLREVGQDTRDRRIEWTTHPLPPVAGDQAMLRMALANLVSNAVKYSATREVAEIEIGAKPAVNGERVLYVRDNGVGFDMAYADKLFGVFQRLHSAEEFEGTGIGLANVRRIVQRHGGKTWAEGSVDGGATFFISLPAGEGSHGPS